MSVDVRPGKRWLLHWTIALALVLAMFAAVAVHRLSDAPKAPSSTRPPVVENTPRVEPGAESSAQIRSPDPRSSSTAPDPARSAVLPSKTSEPSGTRFDPATTKAWQQGFRESSASDHACSLTGVVTSPKGPVPKQPVKIDWVLSFMAPTKNAVHSVHVRPDGDGTLWTGKYVVTDENGSFSADGLPNTQLRITVGNQTSTTYPGGSVHVSLEKDN